MSHIGFSLEHNSAAFEILSDSLYKDKVLAVIREICCNAYDAQIEAGNSTKPFDIHIPTNLETFFRVRDYGKGLSSEQIEELYTVFFRSSKTTDARATGNFGIGAKTPFALVSEFYVFSYQNGYKTSYICKIKDDMPVIECLSVVKDESEPDGLEVKFDIPKTGTAKYIWKSGSESEWSEKAFEVLDVFSVKPNCNIEISYSHLEEEYQTGENYEILPLVSGIFVQMGNVRYPVQAKLLPKFNQEYKDVHEYSHRYHGLCIHVPPKSLKITPSREEISYNKETSEFLDDYIINVFQKHESRIRSEINNQPNFGCVINYYSNLIQNFRNPLTSTIDVETLIYNEQNFHERNQPCLLFKNSPSLSAVHATLGSVYILDNVDKAANDLRTINRQQLTTNFNYHLLMRRSSELSRILFVHEDVKCSASKLCRSAVRFYRDNIKPKDQENDSQYQVFIISNDYYETFKNAFNFDDSNFIKSSNCDIISVKSKAPTSSSLVVAKPKVSSFSFSFKTFKFNKKDFDYTISKPYANYKDLFNIITNENDDGKIYFVTTPEHATKNNSFPSISMDGFGHSVSNEVHIEFLEHAIDNKNIYIFRDINNTNRLLNNLEEKGFSVINYYDYLREKTIKEFNNNPNCAELIQYAIFMDVFFNLKLFQYSNDHPTHGGEPIFNTSVSWIKDFNIIKEIESQMNRGENHLFYEIFQGKDAFGKDPSVMEFNNAFISFFHKSFAEFLAGLKNYKDTFLMASSNKLRNEFAPIYNEKILAKHKPDYNFINEIINKMDFVLNKYSILRQSSHDLRKFVFSLLLNDVIKI